MLSIIAAGVSAASGSHTLRIRPVAPPAEAQRLERAGRFVLPMRPAELEAQHQRERRWRGARDVLTRPGVDWSPRAARRKGWREPARPFTGPKSATSTRLLGVPDPPDTLRVLMLRVDFAADRGGEASTGDGRFDLTPTDPNVPPIDRPPRNRSFYSAHLEALSRYYDVQSYGRVQVEGDVYPRDENSAYTVSDMADFGPWEFSQDIYGAAVRMFRTFLFAADSQSIERGDRIPWDDFDRIVIIHAGSDLQSDVRLDSPEDIPSFTIGVTDTDRVIFPDSILRAIDRGVLVPETINQDGYFGAINGVLAHECGHLFFGFADLYDINWKPT